MLTLGFLYSTMSGLATGWAFGAMARPGEPEPESEYEQDSDGEDGDDDMGVMYGFY